MWLPRPPAAPLILGNNLSAIDAPTLSVLTNTEAIAVSQDALGVQARRVAVQQPKNSTLGFSGQTNIAVVAACDASRPTQCAISPSCQTAMRIVYMYLCLCAGCGLGRTKLSRATTSCLCCRANQRTRISSGRSLGLPTTRF